MDESVAPSALREAGRRAYYCTLELTAETSYESGRTQDQVQAFMSYEAKGIPSSVVNFPLGMLCDARSHSKDSVMGSSAYVS